MLQISSKNGQICKNCRFKTYCAKKWKTKFGLKIMPLPRKFPGDAHADSHTRWHTWEVGTCSLLEKKKCNQKGVKRLALKWFLPQSHHPPRSLNTANQSANWNTCLALMDRISLASARWCHCSTHRKTLLLWVFCVLDLVGSVPSSPRNFPP